MRDSVRACSYDELIAADDVDALYIALPNQLHAEWSKKAADAGKHVLCEKPATPTRAETEAMIEHCVAPGSSGWRRSCTASTRSGSRSSSACGAARSASCGPVRSVFTFTVRDPQNIRRRPEAFGGSLYDVGVYCVNASRWLVGRSPVAVSGQLQLSPEGVDEEFQGLLDFGDGQTALISSSLSQPYRHEVELLGTAGRILIRTRSSTRGDLWFEVEDAAARASGSPFRATTSTGSRSRTSPPACATTASPRSCHTATRSRTRRRSTRSTRRAPLGPPAVTL